MKFGGLYSKFHGSFPLMTINSFMITGSVMKELREILRKEIVFSKRIYQNRNKIPKMQSYISKVKYPQVFRNFTEKNSYDLSL